MKLRVFDVSAFMLHFAAIAALPAFYRVIFIILLYCHHVDTGLFLST